MEGMTEWYHDVCEPTGSQYSFYLSHDLAWAPYVFENRIAFDTLQQARLEWEMMGVGQYVHAASRKQVNVDIPIHEAPRSPDVKIPASERSIDLFCRVQDEWVRGRHESIQSRTPRVGCLRLPHQKPILSARKLNLPSVDCLSATDGATLQATNIVEKAFFVGFAFE
jgi:hypothetical protein